MDVRNALLEQGLTGADLVRLRAASGLSAVSAEGAERAVAGSWAVRHVVERASGTVVTMGRLIGDGGIFFVVDMAVAPDHQRRGLGDAVLTSLVDAVRADAPAGARVSLLADAPGRRLYARHGFVYTTPTDPAVGGSAGMVLRVD